MNPFSANAASSAAHRFRSLPWLEPGAIGLTVVLALLSFIVVCPIYLLLISGLQVEAGSSAAGFSFAAWRAAFSEPGIAKAFLNTLVVTGLVQGISIPIAILIACGQWPLPVTLSMRISYLPNLTTKRRWSPTCLSQINRKNRFGQNHRGSRARSMRATCCSTRWNLRRSPSTPSRRRPAR